jgi:hypothetical protein
MASALDCFVDTAFGFRDADFGTFGARYSSRTGTRRICRQIDWRNPNAFIRGVIDAALVDLGQWSARDPFPGANWELRTRPPHISDDERRDEVGLERAIVRFAQAQGIANVFYQIPATSGFSGSGSRCAIDLAHEHDGAYELIELKAPKGMGSPPAAAIQILRYFAAFLDARERLQGTAFMRPILAAPSIRLCVLGPRDFYGDLDLAGFERFLNDGLSSLGRQVGLTLSFKFQLFPQDPRSLASDGEIFDAFVGRADVCPSGQ